MAVRIFQSGESTGVQKIFSENLDRSLPSDSIHASLRSSIRLLFYFFSFQPFLSAIPSVSLFLSSYIASYAREYMNPIFVKVTRGTIRGKPQKSNGRSTCFATRNAGRLACVCVFGNFLIIKKLARNRKFLVFSTLSISISGSNDRKTRKIERG